jgi:hypothetical protein
MKFGTFVKLWKFIDNFKLKQYKRLKWHVDLDIYCTNRTEVLNTFRNYMKYISSLLFYCVLYSSYRNITWSLSLLLDTHIFSNFALRVLYWVAPGFLITGFLAIIEGVIAYGYFDTIGCDPLVSKQISNPNQVLQILTFKIQLILFELANNK